MGSLLQNGAGETYNYTLNDVTQEQKDFTRRMYANLQKGYHLDNTYKDGDATELVNFFPEKNYRHNYHAQIACRAMKLAAEENGYAHFINGSCFPDQAHGGYFEYGGELDFFDAQDWRIAADVAYVARRYMAPPLISCLLYWTDTARSNRYVMYGTTPHLGMLWTDMDTCHSFLTAELAFEEKDAELIVNDAVHPNWWKFETETLESALLKSGKSYVLPLINHAPQEKSENIEVRLAGLEIDLGAPIYLWQIQPLIPRGYDYTAHIPEKRSTVAYQLQILSAALGSLKIAATALRPNQPKVLAFSQVPAFVYSVNGRRSNLLLCSSRGVAIDGKSEAESVTLSVRNEEPAAEILILLRDGAGRDDDRPGPARAVRVVPLRRAALRQGGRAPRCIAGRGPGCGAGCTPSPRWRPRPGIATRTTRCGGIRKSRTRRSPPTRWTVLRDREPMTENVGGLESEDEDECAQQGSYRDRLEPRQE